LLPPVSEATKAAASITNPVIEIAGLVESDPRLLREHYLANFSLDAFVERTKDSWALR